MYWKLPKQQLKLPKTELKAAHISLKKLKKVGNLLCISI